MAKFLVPTKLVRRPPKRRPGNYRKTTRKAQRKQTFFTQGVCR